MTDKIEQVKCQCGHPKYTHNVFTGECEVRTCKCTLYSQEPQKVVCPRCKGDGHWFLPIMGTSKVCTECNGTGKVPPSVSTEIAELKSQLTSCVETLKTRDNQLEQALDTEQEIKEKTLKELAEVLETTVSETYGYNNLKFIEIINQLKSGKLPKENE